ncbi:MAG TPA: hypothetical protein VFB93_14895 [Burkholderiales bacterium]|nr:hypothetical protein [Burkholderiales bacterium]
MKGLGYAILAVAALVSLVFVNALKPNSLGAAVFIAGWLVLPYAALAAGLMFLAKERASAMTCLVVITIVTAGGLLFLTYVIFLHPDPQGGIAVLLTPVYQAIGIGVLVPTCRWLIGKASA